MTVVCRRMTKAGGLRAFPLGVIRVPTWFPCVTPDKRIAMPYLECTLSALKAVPKPEQ
ncbi:hypothetical protein FIV06_00940 [Labrenzia sp. THAF191b]|uniref:hypothetical protein n=1 Tax=unclassified Labrenzia TaxID=2648686 RepID=UPI0012A7942D|nr:MULTISPECIES: hypothetical protein [unclassified Labrenzia]QFS95962.1 hypothetical protein FIV06_00940 [Labrenzia sp. THAF191b]QFT02277.1 hypothetical protein FIV05_00940 [Labrenzia sp. THAF191a]QFT13818.1 hypothetical protein FIV03_00940 [Labrenzia sp. THAF187b]